jgi:hypothetical protein
VENNTQSSTANQPASGVTYQLHVTNRSLLSVFASFRSDWRPVFCDWLTMHQVHDTPLPVINDGFFVSFPSDALGHSQSLDIATGELSIRPSFDATKAHFTSSKSVKHEGSYETGIQVRCDGYKVEVSGNISRFCRPDNVFGLSVFECIEKFNQVLEHFGLPPFSQLADRVPMARSDTYGVPASNAVITRVDLTSNYATGSQEQAKRYIHSMGGQASKARGKGKNAPRSYSNGVTWNEGSRRWYAKLYYKADDLGKSASTELSGYCNDKGIVRYEVSIKSTELAERGLNQIMGWIGKDGMEMENVIYGEFAEVLERNSVSTLDLSDIPGKAGLIAKDYMNGGNPTASMPSSTARRWRKTLLPYGIDLAVPCNVTRLSARVETIVLTQLQAPDWYVKQQYA